MYTRVSSESVQFVKRFVFFVYGHLRFSIAYPGTNGETSIRSSLNSCTRRVFVKAGLHTQHNTSPSYDRARGRVPSNDNAVKPGLHDANPMREAIGFDVIRPVRTCAASPSRHSRIGTRRPRVIGRASKAILRLFVSHRVNTCFVPRRSARSRSNVQRFIEIHRHVTILRDAEE